MYRGQVRESCFSLVELVIVIVIIAVIAAVVVPRVSPAGEEARLTELKGNLQAVRKAIDLYALDHHGRAPNIKHNGDPDSNGDKFVERLVERTDVEGKPAADGQYGPYLHRFPENPFIDDEGARAEVRIDSAPPGDDTEGWHYNPDSGAFSADSAEHTSL